MKLKKFLKQFSLDYTDEEENLIRNKKNIYDKEISLYKQEQRLNNQEELLSDKERVINGKIACAKDLAANEHEYHSEESKRRSALAKLDAEIEFKKELRDALRDDKDKEISLLKESNASIIKSKDDIIDLLKSQVEILTAKLTEIKITDAHLNVDVTGLLNAKK